MSLLDLKAEMVRHRIRQRQVAALLGLSEGRLSDILLGCETCGRRHYRQDQSGHRKTQVQLGGEPL